MTDFVSANIWILVMILILCKIVHAIFRTRYVGNLSERYVLITGCGKGIGYHLARRLDSKGVRVIASCETQQECRNIRDATSQRLSTIIMDVTDHDSVVNAYRQVKQILPSESVLWAVVNNAGVGKLRGFLEWTRLEDYKHTLGVNLFGAIDVTLTFLPLLKKSGGRLVQVISICGRVGLTSLAGGYCESKFALEAFSDITRRECIRLGYPVKVVVIEPGFISTTLISRDAFASSIDRTWDRLTEEEKAQFAPDAALKRCREIVAGTQMVMAKNLSPILNTMEHALFASWPKTRYTMGWDGHLIWIPLSYLPTFISDPILARC